MVRALQEGITRSALYSYIPERVLSKAGIQLEQYVAICIFGGSDCDITRDFRRLFHPYYYNCYTYNDPLSSPATDHLHSSSAFRIPRIRHLRTSDCFLGGTGVNSRRGYRTRCHAVSDIRYFDQVGMVL